MEGLYGIVDVVDPADASVVEITRALLGDREAGGHDGASVVQLRAKHASTSQRALWAEQMLGPCRAAGVPLIVNDDFEAAIAAGADGLHLGQDDHGADDIDAVRTRARARGRGDLQIGLSTHDLGQLREAGRQGPDYLALGPIGPTQSKLDPDPVVGFTALLDGCRLAPRPLVAIGGMDLERGRRALEYGASAVAVIGALRFDDVSQIRTTAMTMARAFRQAAAPVELDEVHRRIPVFPAQQLHELARWGDALGVHIGLGLPARFAPWVEDGRALYRPCDVIDLIAALGKLPNETWDQWRARAKDDDGPLVQLRRL
ncbi:MAG: thiamine phosphate synthase [Deltaproteobacteria bacterium]|nr:thiamine phosphate synthase [Deltaproteobacteria bacterium]